MNEFEKRAIVYACACHALIHILELTYGTVLAGIREEFGAGFLLSGVLANVFGFAFGFAALPVGVLADRLDERRLLMFCSLGMGLASIGIGLAPNTYALGAALLLLGLALGIFHPVSSAFVARVIRNRGMGYAYLGVGGNIGLAAGPILAGSIASLWGWRASYLVFAVPALVLAVLFRSFSRAELGPGIEPRATEGAGKGELRAYAIPLSLILFGAVMNGFIYRGAMTFLPVYLSERVAVGVFDLDMLFVAGSFTTLALLFGVLGQFLGGSLSEKRRREVVALLSATATVPLLLVVSFTTEAPLMLGAAGFAFFHFMGQPVYNALVADYSPAHWRGRLFGIYFFCTFGVGSFSATLLGYVAEAYGMEQVFTTSAGFGVLVALATAILLVRAVRGKGIRPVQ
ncbi:MAG: MFS transporter [Chloroflexota bacterium]